MLLSLFFEMSIIVFPNDTLWISIEYDGVGGGRGGLDYKSVRNFYAI